MKRDSRLVVLLALGLLIVAILVSPAWTQSTWSGIELPLISQKDSNGAVAFADAVKCKGDACVSLAGAVLRPSTNDAEWEVVDESGCLSATGGSSDTIWSAPVYLKQGVTVNRLTMYAKDATTYSYSKAWFTIYDYAGEIVEKWEVKSDGRPAMSAYSSEGSSGHTVDQAEYRYVVYWQPNELANDVQVCGFLIDYQAPDPGGMEDDSYPPRDVVGGSTQESILSSFSCELSGIPAAEDLPAILPVSSLEDWQDDGIRRLCLYGFPLDERLDVAIATIDGEYAAHGAFRMQRQSASPQPTFVPPVVVPEFPVATAVVASETVETEGMKVIVSMFSDLQLEEIPSMDAKPPRLTPWYPWVADETESLEVVQLEPDAGERAGAAVPHAEIKDGVTVLSLPLWWPTSLPSGVWFVAAIAPGFEDTVAVFFEPFSGISTRPEEEISPFVNHHCDSYEPGETMIIEGANLDPDSSLLLGLYRLAENHYERADRLTVSTDGEGSFAWYYEIPSTYQDGEYLIVQASDLYVDESGFGVFRGSQPCFQVSRPLSEVPTWTDETLVSDDLEGRSPDFQTLAVRYDDRLVRITIGIAGIDDLAGEMIYMYGTYADLIQLDSSGSFRLLRDNAADGHFEELVYSGSPEKINGSSLGIDIPVEYLPDISEKRIWGYSMQSKDRIPDEGDLRFPDSSPQ